MKMLRMQLIVGAVALTAAQLGNAATVVYADNRFVAGGQVRVSSFYVQQAGKYRLELDDYRFDDGFTSLNAAVRAERDSTETLAEVSFDGSADFNAQAGHIYHIAVKTGFENPYGLGLYGVQIRLLPTSESGGPTISERPPISAVPLPAAAILLGSALGGMGLVGRFGAKRKRRANGVAEQDSDSGAAKL